MASFKFIHFYCIFKKRRSLILLPSLWVHVPGMRLTCIVSHQFRGLFSVNMISSLYFGLFFESHQVFPSVLECLCFHIPTRSHLVHIYLRTWKFLSSILTFTQSFVSSSKRWTFWITKFCSFRKRIVTPLLNWEFERTRTNVLFQ